jgi:two-component system NtrC family sensor kinase
MSSRAPAAPAKDPKHVTPSAAADEVFEGLSAIVFGMDRAGTVVLWNEGAERALGLPRTEALGRRFEDLPLPWSDSAITTGILSVERKTRRNLRFEQVPFTRGDGRAGILGFTANAMDGERGGVEILVLGRDLTDQILRERQQLQGQKLEAVGQLAAGLAHEINTPTQYLSDNLHFLQDSFADVLRILRTLTAAASDQDPVQVLAAFRAVFNEVDGGYLIDEIPRAIKQSLGGVDRIGTIVSAMDSFASPGGPDRVRASLNKAICDAVTVTCNVWRHHAEVLYELCPSGCEAECHLSDLSQVMTNLLTNATHAIQDAKARGLISYGLISVGTERDGGHARFWVQDNGTGIAPGILERIYDPFFTTKPVGRGTGQGLSFARAIVVEKHKGKIDVESTLGKGSRFTVTIPRE